MKNLILIFVLWIPFRVFSQTDTQPVPIIHFDTTWNHHILESDLILYVEIQHVYMVTEAGGFEGKVIQVIKGEYSDTNFSINLELIEFSRIRMEKRLSAICPAFDNKWKIPYRCYVGFVRSGPYYDFIIDPSTQRKYYFFMSEKDLNTELKEYFVKTFWMKKLFNMYFRWMGISIFPKSK
jgi:hypothetical protein